MFYHNLANESGSVRKEKLEKFENFLELLRQVAWGDFIGQ